MSNTDPVRSSSKLRPLVDPTPNKSPRRTDGPETGEVDSNGLNIASVRDDKRATPRGETIERGTAVDELDAAVDELDAAVDELDVAVDELDVAASDVPVGLRPRPKYTRHESEQFNMQMHRICIRFFPMDSGSGSFFHFASELLASAHSTVYPLGVV